MGAVKNAMFDVAETLERDGNIAELFERYKLTRDEDKLAFLFEGFVFGLEAEMEYPASPIVRSLYEIAIAIKHQNLMEWANDLGGDNGN